MFNLGNFLNKIKSNPNAVHHEPTTSKVENNIKKVKNWYEERYETIVVQRNLLFALLIVLLLLSIIAVAVIGYVVNSKQFDPFVIQIDDSTGIAKIVNPLTTGVLNGNEALAKYFIKKYVTARETYNPVDFETEARKNVRLLSANNIFWDYIGYIRKDDNNPLVRYGQKNTTYLTVKSWSKLADNKYLLRFAITETAQAQRVLNKIAVVQFEYLPMELTETERDINPIGFQVTGYRVDNDNS